MLSRVLFLILFSSYTLIEGTEYLCPSEEFIQPCSCTLVAFGNHVVCGTINSTEVLTQVFNVLSDYKVHTFVFNSLRLSTPVSASTFSKMSIINLRFEDSVFSLSEDTPPFEGLENFLNVLDISNCNIGHLSEVTFDHLGLLREVNMNFDEMIRVRRNWFRQGPGHLKTLHLDHNHIETIEDNAFRGLVNLETLSLADNNLQEFSRNILPRPALKLNWLDLSYNKLETLSIRTFEKMPQLKRVVLTGNNLRSLPIDTWGRIWNQLDSLIVKDNPLECDNKIKWVIEHSRQFSLHGSCRAPKELTGTHLSMLTEDQLQSR